MPPTRFVFGLCMAAMLAAAAPCAAQPVGWRHPAPAYGYAGRGDDPREGMVNVSRYVAKSPNIGSLGHGRIMVAQAPGTMAAGLETATYEAAVVDQLAKA